MSNLAQEIGDLLRRRGLTLGVVESATGGLISHLITDVPGSSDYYKGSVTAYSNEAKVRLVGVKEEQEKGHVKYLEPGKKITYQFRVQVLDGSNDLGSVSRLIDSLV